MRGVVALDAEPERGSTAGFDPPRARLRRLVKRPLFGVAFKRHLLVYVGQVFDLPSLFV